MRVIEIFQSRQGEGIWTGQYSVFVRTLGCNLRCRYCDTSYAQLSGSDDDEEGADLSPEEIVGRVMLLDLSHVVITGGEPMISPEIGELTRLLKEYDYQITIETAGTMDADVRCDLMSISPKLSNSTPIEENAAKIGRHEALRSRPDVVRNLMLRYPYQLKFVIDTVSDLHETDEYLAQFPNVLPDRVLLMPQAIDESNMSQKAEWIIPYCEEHAYRYCPRMQIIWFGNKRRT